MKNIITTSSGNRDEFAETFERLLLERNAAVRDIIVLKQVLMQSHHLLSHIIPVDERDERTNHFLELIKGISESATVEVVDEMKKVIHQNN